MINGQLNFVSMLATLQPVTQETVVMMDGAQQNGSSFAETLSGMESLAKTKALPDSGQTEQLTPDVDAGSAAVVLLAAIPQLPQISSSTLESSATHLVTKQENSEPAEVSCDAAAEQSETTDLKSQIALALSAYTQSGRMPEVNIPASLPVDTLQKPTADPVQTVVISAVPMEKQPEQISGELSRITSSQSVEQSHPALQSDVLLDTAKIASQTVKSDRMSEVNQLMTLPVDNLQNVATAKDKPNPVSTAPTGKYAERVTVEFVQPAEYSAKVAVNKIAQEHAEPAADSKAEVNVQVAEPEQVISGRISDSGTSKPLPADMLQKSAALAELPILISTVPIEKQTERVHAEAQQVRFVQPAESMATATAMGLVQERAEPVPESKAALTVSATEPGQLKSEIEQPTQILTLPIVKQEVRVTAEPLALVLPAEDTATESVVQLVRVNAEPVKESGVVVTVPNTEPRQVKSDRMSDVNKSTPPIFERLQNVASIKDQPTLFSDSPENIQVNEKLIEPLNKQVLSAITVSTPSTVEPIVKSEALPADLTAITEKTSAIRKSQSDSTSALLTVSKSAASPESEIEIQLSQPQPIIVRTPTSPVVTDAGSATQVAEIAGNRQQVNPEQQNEKGKGSNEQISVKQSALSESKSMPDSGSSSGRDSNQEQPEGAPDNQSVAQDMRGQLIAEHQKTAAVTSKAAPAEPVRQDMPEQVAQQVRERLVQHDVKQGSQQITLTLSPDTLGEIKMNLNLQGQKLSVEIVAENRAVRDAIVQHTDALKESLARQNISMESFDVTTSGKGSGNQGQNQNAWRELAKQQQQQHLWTSTRGYQAAQADLPSGQVAYQRQQGQSMLDIHY